MSQADRTPRTALVTGADQPAGRVLALALAEADWSVALQHAPGADIEALVASARAHGVRAVPLDADLADEAALHTLVGRAAAALGPVGCLANGAAAQAQDSDDRAAWDRQMAVNLRAPFVLARHLAEALPADAEGVVVTLVDDRIRNLSPRDIGFTASKAGLWTMTQSLALALAPRVRVNAITPDPADPAGMGAQGLGTALQFILSATAMTGQTVGLGSGRPLGRPKTPAAAKP